MNVDNIYLERLNKDYKTYHGHHINKYFDIEFTFYLYSLIDNSLNKKIN